MIVTAVPKKIALYPNPDGKSMAQVKAETGCTHIINGGSFDSLESPNCQLKIGGKVYVDDGYRYWGYAWNDANDFGMCVVPCSKANYIALIDLLRDGKNGDMYVKPAYDGSRQRTAIGKTADGKIVLYCTQGGRKPIEVREEMREAGCVDAILLDSGLSSQCDFNGLVLEADRIVHNFICIWAEDSNVITILKKGSKGENVRALQNNLKTLGANIEADGDFGSITEAAVKSFQKDMNLTANGIVGDITLAVLNTAVTWKASNNTLVLKAGRYLGFSEPNDDDAIIDAFNDLAGSAFGHSDPWCQMFAVVCMADAGLDPFVTASCTLAYTHYQAIGAAETLPAVGRLIYFDWDRSGDCDHVGIVVAVSNGYVYVIEGNSGGSGADAVRMKRYLTTDAKIRGYANPAAEGQPTYYIVKMSRAAAERLARDYGGEVVKYND